MIAIRKDAMRYRDPETGKFVGVSLIGGDAPSDTSGTPVEIDGTLTQSGKAADAKAVGDRLTALNQANAEQDERLTALEQNAPSGTSGLTVAQVNALDGMFNVVAYDGDKDYAAAYQAFKSAFGIVTMYTVKNNLTNVTSDNNATSIASGSSYTATLTVTDGYTMSAVFVYMGGTDITSTAYSNGVINIESVTGDIVISATATVAGVTTYTITNNLTNATSSNPAVSIEEGQAYSATITPDEGYTLTGGAISVTMGGSDVTASTYADGVVTISPVTGDVVITVAAAMVESDEITYVDYIATDGTAVIDTGYIPTSINDKMLIGVKYFAADEIDSSITNRRFFGRSYPFGSTYGDILAYTENELTDGAYPYRMSMMVNSSGGSRLDTIQSNYDDGTYATFVKQPLYYYWSNGSQKLYEDYDMTTQPKQGTFGNINKDIATGTRKGIAINSMWIGGYFDGYTGNSPVGFPIYIYGFKAWDENDNLLCNLRPARKGVECGLYDVVNNVFHGNGTEGGTITCGKDVTA